LGWCRCCAPRAARSSPRSAWYCRKMFARRKPKRNKGDRPAPCCLLELNMLCDCVTRGCGDHSVPSNSTSRANSAIFPASTRTSEGYRASRSVQARRTGGTWPAYSGVCSWSARWRIAGWTGPPPVRAHSFAEQGRPRVVPQPVCGRGLARTGRKRGRMAGWREAWAAWTAEQVHRMRFEVPLPCAPSPGPCVRARVSTCGPGAGNA
jgi:hypothetical protein